MASKTELAKAYVEIIPSATGIGGKISEALGGEVTAAGATAGQSLGKSLIGAVGKILAAAGIGIGTLGSMLFVRRYLKV